MRYRVLLAFILGMFPGPFLSAAPVQQAFSDWQVTCNNQNFCATRNTGEHAGLVMTLARSAGAQTDAVLRIELGGKAGGPAKDAPIAPRLLLDGKPLELTAGHWQISPWRLMTNDAQTITAFLQTVQDAQAVTLQGGQGMISLVGLKAALLFIDAQQKRVGSETAWIQKGDDPPLSVPPAPALKGVALTASLPVPLTQQELDDLLDYGNWRMNNSPCSLDPMRREMRVAALSDDQALLLIDCEAGAYNTVSLAWLVSRTKPFSSRPLRLRLPFTPPHGSSELELMNARFDEKTRELTTLAKGRGLADCGVATRWRFDGQRFRLTRFAGEPTCDNWHGPDAWPTLWVTR